MTTMITENRVGKALQLLLILCLPLTAAFAGNNDQDTLRKPASPVITKPAKAAAQPDTGAYDNPLYRNAIRHAEYQNRGAEDRRNPDSGDPKAIPDKRVPDETIRRDNGK